MKLDLEHFIAISRLTILKNYYNLFGGLGIEWHKDLYWLAENDS
jgi:hypothetical protein